MPVLGLATFHRLFLRRVALRAAAALRSTVRLEAALVLLVVLGGSILALLAPPVVAHSDLKLLDLAAPTTGVMLATTCSSGSRSHLLRPAPTR